MHGRRGSRITKLLADDEQLLDVVVLHRPFDPELCTPGGGIAAAMSSGRTPARSPGECWWLIATDRRIGIALDPTGKRRSAARWAPTRALVGLHAFPTAEGACRVELDFRDGSHFSAIAAARAVEFSPTLQAIVVANRVVLARRMARAS